MNIILGIDPGLRHTGWGIIQAQGSSLKFIDAGVISPNASMPMAERLLCLHNHLEIITKQYDLAEAAIEEVFVNSNSQSSLKLGQARGSIILSLAISHLPLYEYSTRLVKKSIVGVGKADKEQVKRMVEILLPGSKINKYDASDALAVAICHANHRTIFNKGV